MILSNGKANKMTEKIIISKELNEWLEEHQTLDTDNTIYSERFEVVYSFDKARSTLQGRTSNKENEKLFMVKNS